MLFRSPLDGKVYLFLGSVSGLSTTPAWTRSSGGTFGDSVAVATAGDVNKDGRSDLIIGAQDASTGTLAWKEGAALLFLGTSSGLGAAPTATLWPPSSIVVGDARFGASVATAGDVNGDGYSDVIIGAPGINKSLVYHGSNSG